MFASCSLLDIMVGWESYRKNGKWYSSLFSQVYSVDSKPSVIPKKNRYKYE